jgi:hypothetical protein
VTEESKLLHLPGFEDFNTCASLNLQANRQYFKFAEYGTTIPATTARPARKRQPQRRPHWNRHLQSVWLSNTPRFIKGLPHVNHQKAAFKIYYL